jgi:hypothetical protein
MVSPVIIRNDTNKLILGRNGNIATKPKFHNIISANDTTKPNKGNTDIKLP